ncbi:MAG: hypothetical protein ACREBG_23800 [Pyrinomonadaceae bacterium]
MKTLKRFLPILVLVGIVGLTMVPTVLADGSGPQGGSNSGTPRPPPPPPPSNASLLEFLIWLITVLFGLY